MRILCLGAAFILLFGLVPVNTTVGQGCAPALPIPTGTTAKPLELFDPAEQFSLHGSMPLQGNPAREKFGHVLQSSAGGGFGNFQTAVGVINIDANAVLNVDINLYDSAGNLVLADNVDILPNAKHQQVLWQLEGITSHGMVHVEATAGSAVQEFVGFTAYSADTMVNPLNSSLPLINSDEFMNSIQPLQEAYAKRMDLGPFSIRFNSIKDILAGTFTRIAVSNPNDVDNDVTLTMRSENGLQFSSNVTIPARGSLENFDIWIYQIRAILQSLPDDDVTMTIVSRTNLPIIAEAQIFDPISNDDNSQTRSNGTKNGDIDPTKKIGVGGRLRMTSVAGSPGSRTSIVSTELTQFSGLEVENVVSIVNVASATTTDVLVEYYGSDGSYLGLDNLGSMPQSTAFHLGFGLPESPNFPDGVFRGWVRITSCGGKLIGYTNRANESELSTQKMWGEALHGTLGREHRTGRRVAGMRELTVPLVFQFDRLPNPSYTTAVNDNRGNVGPYNFEAFTEDGIPDGSASFIGLRAPETTGTYFDSFVNTFANAPHSGRVRVSTGHVKGICVIGGNLLGHLFFEFTQYPGPGDLVW